MAVVEDPISAGVCMIDEAYEFSAPRFYDFMVGETEEEVRKAEMWFESACSYAPSRMSLFAPFFSVSFLNSFLWVSFISLISS